MRNRHCFQWLVFSIIGYAIAALLMVFFSYILKYIIDAAVSGNMPNLVKFSIFCVASVIATFLAYTLAIYSKAKYVGETIYHLRQQLMEAILRLAPAKYRKKESSYYQNILTNDVDKVEQNYYSAIPELIFEIILFLAAVVAMIFISPILLLVFMAVFLIPMIFPQLITNALTKKQNESSIANEAFLESTKENTFGHHAIYKNNCRDSRLEAYKSINMEQQVKHNRAVALKEMGANIASTSGAFSQVLAMIFGAYMVTKNRISVGELIVAIQLLNFVFNPINEFGTLIPGMRSLKTIRKKLQGILDEKEELSSEEKDFTKPTIVFENVSLNLDGKPILQNLSHVFQPNTKVLITGESGVGKSTLVKLLMKYYDDFNGEITINGTSIRDIPAYELYTSVAEVEQDPYLFNSSIRDNIILGLPYDETLYQKTIETCHLSSLLRENGEKNIGEFAGKISGGEKQRIALARALYRKSKIIVLDEPTSALDPDKAKELMDTILSLEDTNVIVISHDWSDDFISRFDDRIHLSKA
ncbi:MAG: ABC transporter ATP-binding protein [Tissierellia bacterium]|nr:ABC transporter ATP-binding protein [Tissierellia bacterium]